jgi:dienelactone hydrolase
MNPSLEQLIRIPVDDVHMEGMLSLPAKARGIVLFAHGSGSSRHSPRNNFVAQVLRDQGIGTLLLDLLTLAEDLDYQTRFDIALLTHRLLVATRWIKLHEPTSRLPIGYFGASTGAAAALQAAAALGEDIHAVVSRGGRPDLAGSHDLAKVKCPTLLLVGSRDEEVLELNREAYIHLPCTKELSIIPGATHLFEEKGTLEEVARQAAIWFSQYLKT